ncbi:hypothetical protein D3C76_1380510 [compost metagenome]
MPQITLCTKTLCSYIATSAPRRRGLMRSTTRVLLGRLPGITLCGASLCTSASLMPLSRSSVSASAKVLPSISAWLCDRQLAYSHWWWSDTGLKLTIGTMKSAGISWVPWCSNWW